MPSLGQGLATVSVFSHSCGGKTVGRHPKAPVWLGYFLANGFRAEEQTVELEEGFWDWGGMLIGQR